jgi:circadian clock protein KaiC
VIADPLNSFIVGSNETEVKSMLIRLVDFLKMNQITSLFTSLTSGGSALEQS